MRRIRIGEHETLLSEEYKTRMQREQHFDGVLVFPLKRLKSLKKKFDEGLVQEYVGKDEHGHDVYTIPADIDSFGRYVQEIINRYSNDLLSVRPSEMGRVIDAFEAILNGSTLNLSLRIPDAIRTVLEKMLAKDVNSRISPSDALMLIKGARNVSDVPLQQRASRLKKSKEFTRHYDS